MFTQCTNCQAIYRVSMREITVSKGYLRCGECQQIFDSSKNLSTTMQEPYVDIELQNKAKTENLSVESLKTISALDDWQTSHADDPEGPINLKQKAKKKNKNNPIANDQKVTERKSNSFTTKGTEKSTPKEKNKLNEKWPLIAVGLLSVLMLFQLAFNFQNIFKDTPRYEPKKIQMLNHNVFAHPIDKGVLLISASIENTADFDQAFPTLEVRLTNTRSELVALRRFSPNEYLDNFTENSLLTKNRATSIKLKIQDPGNQATRFQFDFL